MAKKTPTKSPDTWPGTFKAIGLKALTTGYFWHFCFLCIMLSFAWHIDSKDWVEIVKAVLANAWIAAIGWGLFGFTVVMSIGLLKFQRETYRSEIERLVEERNRLQEKVAGPLIASSRNGAQPAPERIEE